MDGLNEQRILLVQIRLIFILLFCWKETERIHGGWSTFDFYSNGSNNGDLFYSIKCQNSSPVSPIKKYMF